MQVLIVEDNAQKAKELELALRQTGPMEICSVADVALAKFWLGSETQWSGIVLDMGFHSSRGTAREIIKDGLAGLSLLRYLHREGSTVPVIVATKHQEFKGLNGQLIPSIDVLHEKLLSMFPDNYRATIFVNLATGTWKQELISAVGRHFRSA